MSLTITADAAYRAYANQDPEALFDKATQYLASSTAVNSYTQDILEKATHEAMIHAIHGSNRIEKAGLGCDVTHHLCHKTFSRRIRARH